ncbi:cobalt-precorrin 5A hydrolase/precorrin-3B C17-methyltransferase [Kitasatospora sp. MAA19]|uniref:cobalamin biosynthesis protein n=1 Tax=Kitasatospora sp. MAA19 TaxID=3035090 RepID=UPI002475675A|nr:cobalamin biosynthesis protein [Kitasatospora sp. MAA19]MDH6706148.1 cobalt-precorrin 5A hydrolase/precorrin-3B C17-methyltransferase [Kitasatospora sp. MAA19]
MIGLVALNGAGRLLAGEIHTAWPDTTHVYKASVSSCFGPTEALNHALDRHDLVVCLASVATTVRLFSDASHQGSRRPGLVSLDLGLRYAVPLTDRGTGAEELAEELAALLGVRAVLTGGPPPAEAPGRALAPTLAPALTPTLAGHLDGLASTATRGPRGAAASQAVAEGRPVRLENDLAYPLPALPPSVRPDAPADAPVLRVTDRSYPGEDVLLVHPRTLVVGVGAGGGAEQSELMRLLMDTLEEGGLARSSVARLATVAGKADHPAVRWAAFCLGGVPVDEHPAAALAAVPVPTPSELVGAAVGTPSVAEAAALASAPGGELVATKRKSAAATVAIARTAPRGRLAVVGLGPGEQDLLVPRALAELRRASAVVGTPGAVEAVAGLLRPGTRRIVTDDCTEAALTLAAHGHAVALVALGDGAAPTVPPGPYDVHRVPGLPAPPVPGLPAHPQGDPA